MAPVSPEVEAFMKQTGEELYSRVFGPNLGGPHWQEKLAQQILDHRRADRQADAAKALLQATKKQAEPGDSLVKTTDSLVAATQRLAKATWTLSGMTVFLVVAAGFQAYAMFRWHP
jgi:hypothetical protein